ncbi:hypothetical protein LPJ61_006056, partial [Coemansia biformis]
MGSDSVVVENKRKRQDSVRADEPALEPASPTTESEQQPETPTSEQPEPASPPKRPRTSDVGSDESDDGQRDTEIEAAAAEAEAEPKAGAIAAVAEAKPVGIADTPVFGMSFASARALGGFAAAAKAASPLSSLAAAAPSGFTKYASATSTVAEPVEQPVETDNSAAEEPSTAKSERTFEDMLTAEGKESLATNAAMSTVVPAMAHANMVEMQAEPVRTYEEDETCIFATKAKLFELSDGNWKERGGGQFKVNKRNDSARYRLVMRTDQTFRLILNVPLFPEMKLTCEHRFVRFTCLNTESMAPATFALRFASEAMATEAHQYVIDSIPPPDAICSPRPAPQPTSSKGKDVEAGRASDDDDEEDDEDYEDKGSSSGDDTGSDDDAGSDDDDSADGADDGDDAGDGDGNGSEASDGEGSGVESDDAGNEGENNSDSDAAGSS